MHRVNEAASCSEETNTLVSPRLLSVFSVPSSPGCFRATSEFLFAQSERQRQMREAAAVQRQTALWQQDGQARAAARVACVSTPVAQGSTTWQAEA